MTRGLDPNVKLKPSGVKWIGDIPEYWSFLKLKRIACVKTGYAFKSDHYKSVGIPLIRIGDLKHSGLVDIKQAVKLQESDLTHFSCFKIQYGDLLMAMTGATIGKVAKYQHQTEALLNQRVCSFRSFESKCFQDYLLFILSSEVYLKQVTIFCYGGAQPNISDSTLMSFKIPVPPISEQQAILSYVQEQTKTTDSAVSRAEREIELIQEYYTRLMSDVVTGQVDVRDIEVPEITEEDLLTLEDKSEVVDDDLVQEEDE